MCEMSCIRDSVGWLAEGLALWEWDWEMSLSAPIPSLYSIALWRFAVSLTLIFVIDTLLRFLLCTAVRPFPISASILILSKMRFNSLWSIIVFTVSTVALPIPLVPTPCMFRGLDPYHFIVGPRAPSWKHEGDSRLSDPKIQHVLIKLRIGHRAISILGAWTLGVPQQALVETPQTRTRLWCVQIVLRDIFVIDDVM